MRKVEFTAFFLVFLLACSRHSSPSNNVILFDIEGQTVKKERIEIIDNKISDSLKVLAYVVVNLESPLRDTSKNVKVKSVEILKLSVTTENSQKQIIDFSYRNDNGSDYQKDIWKLCNEKLSGWYKNQPYEKMIGRNNWEDRVVLVVVFYILPGRHNQK